MSLALPYMRVSTEGTLAAPVRNALCVRTLVDIRGECREWSRTFKLNRFPINSARLSNE